MRLWVDFMGNPIKPKAIGETLRQLREESHLSLKTAAPKANVSYTYLSKIENGHKPPSPELLKKLGDIYNADVEQLNAQIGQLPPDILKIVEMHGKEAFDLLRAKYKTRGKF